MLIMIISQSRNSSTSHKQKHIVRITTMEPCTVLKIATSTLRCRKVLIGQAVCLTNEPRVMNLAMVQKFQPKDLINLKVIQVTEKYVFWQIGISPNLKLHSVAYQ